FARPVSNCRNLGKNFRGKDESEKLAGLKSRRILPITLTERTHICQLTLEVEAQAKFKRNLITTNPPYLRQHPGELSTSFPHYDFVRV
ncbi:unnamed protein product, partial [Allacma fusca]